jgi:hypothetical protein
MDPVPTEDEEQALKDFNDPFEVVADTFVRRRHAEEEPVHLEKVSDEDEQRLLSLMTGFGVEDTLISDSCAKMVEMNLVSRDVLSTVQESFDFEKVRQPTLHLHLRAFYCSSLPHWSYRQNFLGL